MPIPYVPGPPYYDDFDPSKEYSKLLYRPGLVLQSEELNETQTMLQYQIQQIANGIYTDGDVLSGAEVLVSEKNTSTGTVDVIITPGQIYLNGLARTIPETRFTVPSTGIVKIGVKFHREVYTEFDDNTILDPASGYPNFKLSGAHRLKEVISVVLNDDSASTMFIIEDGQLVDNTVSGDVSVLDKWTNTLARRTYDESGNYKVFGMEISPKVVAPPDPDYHFISVSDGKAYVEGFEIPKQVATILELNRATDARSVNGEPKVFVVGTREYMLNSPPVSRINSFIAQVSITMQMTRGAVVNGTDPIPEFYRPAVDIQSITQPGLGKTYVKNVDFALVADEVSWGLNGDEPVSGESYTITFTYNRTMVNSVDYDLYFDGTTYWVRLLKNYDEPSTDEHSNTVNGITPGSTMLVGYDFLLYYIASITLNRYGMFNVVRGQSDRLLYVTPPNVTDDAVLVMGNVLVTPLNETLVIQNSDNIRLSMADLKRLAQRIYDLEYNTAITDLDNEALKGEEPTLLKGVYTDGFIGLSKADIHFNQSGVRYTTAINPDLGELTLSSISTPHTLVIDNLNTNNSYTKYNRIITAPATEYTIIDQPVATDVSLINPYQAFPEQPSMNITPQVDNWVDTTTIVLQGGTIINDTVIRTEGSTTRTWISSQTQTTTSKSQILETAIMYMRPQVISVVSRKWGSHSTGIKLAFDGIDIPMSAVTADPDYIGGDGNLKSDVAGEVKCSFTVPANTICGSVGVELYSSTDPNFNVLRTYTANGTLKTTQTTVTTNVFRTIVEEQRIREEDEDVRRGRSKSDPLAQTFAITGDSIVPAIGLYFAVVDPDETITVQVKGMSNGWPTSEILAQKVLYPADISVSGDGSAETKVVFDDPILIRGNTEYAVTILTESATASMYYANLGGYDLITGQQVIKNVYLGGVMLSSSNASTWTAHQSSDLKFKIYGTEYANPGYIYFERISGVDYDRLWLIADTDVPDTTSLTWEYSRDAGVSWLPLALGVSMELGTIINDIMIRAVLTPIRPISPAVAADSIQLVAYKNLTTCDYISRNIVLDDNYTNVKIVVDLYTPSGSNAEIYFASDVQGIIWTAPEQTGYKVKDANGYIQYTFESTLASPGYKNYRMRIRFNTGDSTVRPRAANLMSILK